MTLKEKHQTVSDKIKIDAVLIHFIPKDTVFVEIVFKLIYFQTFRQFIFKGCTWILHAQSK